MKSEIRISIGDGLVPVSTRADSVEVGTAFTGNIGSHESVFLRHYSGVVDLKNPQKTWTDDAPINNFRRVNLQIHVTAR